MSRASVCNSTSRRALTSGIMISGTTGVPKGVVLSHQSHLWVVKTRLGADDLSHHRFLIAAPMFHIADALCVYMVTLLGGTHVVVPRFEPADCARALAEHEISDILLVPTMIQMLLDHRGAVDAADGTACGVDHRKRAFRGQHEETAGFDHLCLFVGVFGLDPRTQIVGMRIGIGGERLHHLHLDIAAELDVGAATGHVGGDRHCAAASRLCNDRCLTLVLLGVQDVVGNPFAIQ